MKAISLEKAHVEEALDLVLSLPPSPLLRPSHCHGDLWSV
jgi:hypothetical protein